MLLGGNDAVVFGDERLFLVERARVLVEDLEGQAERREGGALGRMRVADGRHVMPLGVERRVDGERRLVVGSTAVQHIAVEVDHQEVVGRDFFEEEPERVHPELVVRAGNAAADVACDAVVHAAARDHAERCCELGFQGNALGRLSIDDRA